MGEQILILTFVVVVIGGVGSIRGAFFGALIVGVVDTCLRAFLPGLLRTCMTGSEADALGAGLSSMGIYLLMAIVLLVRPKGLFPAPWLTSHIAARQASVPPRPGALAWQRLGSSPCAR